MTQIKIGAGMMEKRETHEKVKAVEVNALAALGRSIEGPRGQWHSQAF